jgi:hypothetical protein
MGTVSKPTGRLRRPTARKRQTGSRRTTRRAGKPARTRLVELWNQTICFRPRIVIFQDRHDFVLVPRKNGGYRAMCRYCGLYLKKRGK